jgi:hypothetical protein
MTTKWYSNGVTETEAIKLEKVYAKIMESEYGIDADENDALCLKFSLRLENGKETTWRLFEHKDIQALLKKTNSRAVPQLNGKIVEVFNDDGLVKCLGVNENLI